MEKKIKELLGKKNNLIVILLLGVLLLVIAIPVNDKDKETDGQQSGPWSGGTDRQSKESGPERQSEAQDYCTYMERKLEEALSQMDGAGKVRVIISLRSSEEKIVEKDHPITRSGTSETDSQGGTREVSSVDSGETTIYSSDSGASQPYVVKTMLPEIEGVIVLAQGAGTGNVSKNISDAIQVLFGIEAHRIRVVKMEAGN